MGQGCLQHFKKREKKGAGVFVQLSVELMIITKFK